MMQAIMNLNNWNSSKNINKKHREIGKLTQQKIKLTKPFILYKIPDTSNIPNKCKIK